VFEGEEKGSGVLDVLRSVISDCDKARLRTLLTNSLATFGEDQILTAAVFFLSKLECRSRGLASAERTSCSKRVRRRFKLVGLASGYI